MKAEIQPDGTLQVTAENNLETYALKNWSKDNLCPEGLRIAWGENNYRNYSDNKVKVVEKP